MRIVIEFKNEIFLPFKHYNHILQSFIYRNLPKNLAKFLHEEGFSHGKRKFKLFTFSRLIGKSKIKDEFIKISPPVSLKISSPQKEFIIGLINEIMKKQKLKIGENEVEIDNIRVEQKPQFESITKIKMLSPMTVYSTFKKEGKKKQYFYNPKEKDFSRLIEENLKKKYKAFYGKDIEGRLEVYPLHIDSKDLKIVYFKGTVIKGWMGRYELRGDERLMSWAWEVGLGAKNSQGFGMFEVIR